MQRVPFRDVTFFVVLLRPRFITPLFYSRLPTSHAHVSRGQAFVRVQVELTQIPRSPKELSLLDHPASSTLL